MNKKEFILVGIIIFLLTNFISFYTGRYYQEKHTSIPTTSDYDTLRFKVKELSDVIKIMNNERNNIKADTVKIYNNYNNTIDRIRNNPSDSSQLAILRELLDKQNPNGKDINEALAKAKLSEELLNNNREQLLICDSISSIKYSIITTQSNELNTCKEFLDGSIAKNKQQASELDKKTKHLSGWRKVAIGEAVIIVGRIAIRVFLGK